MNRTESLLASLGASESQIAELESYNRRDFGSDRSFSLVDFPMADEPLVSTWEEYVKDAEDRGAYRVLRDKLVQFSFPIKNGISQTEDYRSVTLRGLSAASSNDASGLKIEQPAKLRIELYPTLAGRIPVVLPGNRADFVSLLQALVYRNEPKEVPQSMGASMVKGYNNWDRIHRHQQAWEAKVDNPSPFLWQIEREAFFAQKELYQDKFIILSDGPYSGVDASDMGLSEDEWRHKSRLIRLAHEGTHYFTQRVLGTMQNHVFDELIADYFGIVAAAGEYRASWFLRFVGLEDYPKYRLGGRLQNYRGNPPLSDGAFSILQTLTKRAAENLQQFDRTVGCKLRSPQGQVGIMLGFTTLSLIDLASSEGTRLLQEAVASL